MNWIQNKLYYILDIVPAYYLSRPIHMFIDLLIFYSQIKFNYRKQTDINIICGEYVLWLNII